MSRIEARPRAALPAFPFDEPDLPAVRRGLAPRAEERARAGAGAPAVTAAAAGAVGR
ncbi:hypothetical protein [Streptomyces sp. NPDC002640]